MRTATLDDVIDQLRQYVRQSDKTASDYAEQGDKYGAAWYASRSLAFQQAVELLTERTPAWPGGAS